MQTQCPHCETQFRITEEQYQIADGLVRCGVCKETFNAIEIIHEGPLPLNKDINQEPEQTVKQTTLELADTAIPPETNDSTEKVNEAHQTASQTIDQTTHQVDELNDDDNSPYDPFAHLDSSVPDSTPSSIPSEESLTPLEDSNSVYSKKQYTADNHDKLAANSNLNKAQVEKHESEFDLFQTGHDDTLSADINHSVVPEECRTERSHDVLKGMLWSIAIVFLTFTLALEYVWFNRNQLIQIPQAKPWVERFCEFTNCEIAALRDPAQIELVTRNIYSHPNQKNTLIVAVTLTNHANFAQPYPLMQIDFSDIRGSIVAARRFKPQTYLNTQNEQLRLLAPETSSSFTMMIQDPGTQAMTYEFNFL